MSDTCERVGTTDRRWDAPHISGREARIEIGEAMVLICYDGSQDADAAIDAVAAMMPGQSATILTSGSRSSRSSRGSAPVSRCGRRAWTPNRSTPPPRARRSSERRAEQSARGPPACRPRGCGPTRDDDRRHDRRGGRIDLGECDRPGDARPDRGEVGRARQRLPRGAAPCGPAGAHRPVGRTGGQTVRARILSRSVRSRRDVVEYGRPHGGWVRCVRNGPELSCEVYRSVMERTVTGFPRGPGHE